MLSSNKSCKFHKLLNVNGRLPAFDTRSHDTIAFIRNFSMHVGARMCNIKKPCAFAWNSLPKYVLVIFQEIFQNLYDFLSSIEDK